MLVSGARPDRARHLAFAGRLLHYHFGLALRSPRGRLTLIVANREPAAIGTHLRWEGLLGRHVLHRYELMEEKLQKPGFKLASDGRLTVSARQPDFSHTLPPRSLVVFADYDLGPDAPGVIDE